MSSPCSGLRRAIRGLAGAFLATWIVLGAAGLQAATPPPTYVLVVTGGELLDGTLSDAHTAFLARTLRPMGATCVGVELVDDREEELKGALGRAVRRAPLVIVTGGLGPTVNDITREALSRFSDIPLVEATNVVVDLARRLRTTVDGVPENIRRQARVPVRGTFLANEQGTAVGLVFEAEPALLVALPGPPRELQPMVRNALVPWLTARFGLHPPSDTLTLRFIGLGQSRIDQVLREQVGLSSNLVVCSQFEGSRVDFTFSLPAHDRSSRERLALLEAGVRKHLGTHLYATGTVTLEAAATRLIRERRETLALAEVASGGALATALARDASTRTLVAGAFSAPDFARLLRLVSSSQKLEPARAETADRWMELAGCARDLTGSDWVLVVGGTESEQATPSRVWVVAGLPGNRWEHRRIELRDSAESGRATLVNEVLDWLRRLEP